MTRQIALLRGINVGGKNKVAMSDLRQAFTDAGLENPRTYINSGNVLFDAPAKVAEDDLEGMLEERFGIPLVVVVRSHRQMRAVVEKRPPGFGDQPETYHCDFLFLKAPLTSRQTMKIIRPRAEVDEAWPGTGVVYFQRVSSQRTKSRLGEIIGTPEYQLMTIRSSSTTFKLLEMLDEG